MKVLPLFFYALVIIIISCKKQEQGAQTQMQRVISIHDEVMPKMGEIGRLISALQMQQDSTDRPLQYQIAKDDLEIAHNYMMDWMKGFGQRFDSDEILKGKKLSKEKEVWLNEEEKKVNIMKEMIYSSIEGAKLLLLQH